MRTFGPVVLLILISALDSVAAPAVAKSSVAPESGVLLLLGGGLVGLAGLVRRYLSE